MVEMDNFNKTVDAHSNAKTQAATAISDLNSETSAVVLAANDLKRAIDSAVSDVLAGTKNTITASPPVATAGT